MRLPLTGGVSESPIQRRGADIHGVLAGKTIGVNGIEYAPPPWRRKSKLLGPICRRERGMTTACSSPASPRCSSRARRSAARAINAILTAAYWEIGRRIVEHEQGGKERAGYGEALLVRLAADLTRSHGRGFSKSNLFQMRALFLGWEIFQTPSGKFMARVKSRGSSRGESARVHGGRLPRLAGIRLPGHLPAPWSHYVRLMTSRTTMPGRSTRRRRSRAGGRSVSSTARSAPSSTSGSPRSKRKGLMLRQGQSPARRTWSPADEVVRDPYLLEFLDLKDEYGETELEEALILHLERSSSNSGAGSRSSPVRSKSASTTSGTGSTSCYSTGGSAASSSST